MKPIQIISQDLFDKIRSRFTNLEMGDQEGSVTIDPTEARFFDFDFMLEGQNLGRISVSLNDPGSLKIYYSQGITENVDDDVKKMWYNFLREMRFFAMRRLLRFDTRDVAKTNLDKNDFQYLATTKPKDNETMNMNESRWTQKSSRKTSRAVKGATEVIVRHHNPVDEMYPGSRSQRKNIKAIFIQNREGERFKYPFIHPAGAFAMAQHVDHGGVPHDPAGKAIIRMSEQIAQLQEFQRQVQHTQLHDDAMGITERAVGRLQELKACIERLSRRHHYESWIEEFNETDEPLMADLDPVTMETYKQAFTQTKFNENLASLFPLIHSIMQETNKVDLEDYVNEETCTVCHESPCKCDSEESVKENEFNEFEEWAEAVEQGQLTPEAINELKGKLPNLTLAPDGMIAFNEIMTSLGINDVDANEDIFKDLQERLENAAHSTDENEEGKVQEIFLNWAKEHNVYPEITSQFTQPTEPEVALTSPEQQVDQPVAEGTGNISREIAEIVKRFYNSSNEDVGPFRSEEAICLEVEKTLGEKYGESTGQHAGMIARKFMEKLTKQWEMKHNKSTKELTPVEDDGLSRLRELIGNLKQKVEGIETETADPLTVPAYVRKQNSPGQDAAQKATDKRNDNAGANVWKNPRQPNESADMEALKKLAGLAK